MVIAQAPARKLLKALSGEPAKRKSVSAKSSEYDESDEEMLQSLKVVQPHLAGGGFLQGVAKGKRDPDTGKLLKVSDTEEKHVNSFDMCCQCLTRMLEIKNVMSSPNLGTTLIS